MLKLEKVRPDQSCILERLLQKYLYEMTRFYPDEMGENGDFDYPYLPFYFTEDTRQAFFICLEEKRIGFALVNTHSFTGEKIDSCLAEFTIFPVYRHEGYAQKAVDLLFAERPGTWQLKYSVKNPAGMHFWGMVQERYSGYITEISSDERVLTIPVQK